MKRRDLEKPLLILETTSPLLRRLTRGAGTSQPSAMALRTHVWLMAILEQKVWTGRIERLLAETYPNLRRVNVNQVLLQAERAARNPKSERDPLTVFEDARKANLQLLRSVEPKNWNRSGFLEPAGALFLRDVPRILAEQDQKNLQEISRLLGIQPEARRMTPTPRSIPCTAA
jgi:hypothetical protein